MVTGSREEFLRLARHARLSDPHTPIRVSREIGWHPSLFSHEDGKQPTVVTSSPVVYITYLTWKDKPFDGTSFVGSRHDREPVIFRELFQGEIVMDVATGAGAVQILLDGSLHDWLIANANEVHL